MHRDKKDDETNFEFCERMAAEIPPEDLVKDIFLALARKVSSRRSPRDTLQGELMKLLPYGNGIRCALVRKYFPLSRKWE